MQPDIHGLSAFTIAYDPYLRYQIRMASREHKRMRIRRERAAAVYLGRMADEWEDGVASARVR